MPLASFLRTAVLVGVAVLATPFCSAQSDFPRQSLCITCHGAKGKSEIKGIPSLAGQPRLFIENQLVLMREGVREVPAMKGMLDGLTDGEAVAIAKYYAALPLAGIPADRDERLFSRGEKLAQDMRCGICHLPNFVGREQIPRLAGQREDFLLHSLLEFKNGKALGRDSNMAAAVHGVPDADLAALSHYFARLAP